jgi:hypothetical protein
MSSFLEWVFVGKFWIDFSSLKFNLGLGFLGKFFV